MSWLIAIYPLKFVLEMEEKRHSPSAFEVEGGRTSDKNESQNIAVKLDGSTNRFADKGDVIE